MTSDCLPHQLVLQMDPTELEMHLRALAPVGGSSAASSAAAAAAAAAAASTSAAAALSTAHSTAQNGAQLGAQPARDHEHEHEYLEMVDRLDTSLNLDDDQLGAELGAGAGDEGSLDRSRSHNQV